MVIRLNGEKKMVQEGITLEELVASLSLTNERYAVEINEELIPRSEHKSYTLAENDTVEIVQAIGGG